MCASISFAGSSLLWAARNPCPLVTGVKTIRKTCEMGRLSFDPQCLSVQNSLLGIGKRRVHLAL